MNAGSLRHTYHAVNVAGFVNDTLTHSQFYETASVGSAANVFATQTRSLPHRMVDGVRHAAHHAAVAGKVLGATARGALYDPGIVLGLQLPSLFCAGGVPLALCHPILAHTLVGRGHNPALVLPSQLQCSPLDRVLRLYDQCTHHGLAGYVLEAAPLRGAALFQDHHRHSAASACMIAAVIGRCVLQLPRLMVCAPVIVLEFFAIAPIVGCLFGCEMSVRAVAGLLKMLMPETDWGLARLLATLNEVTNLYDDWEALGRLFAQLARTTFEHVPAYDEGAPGVNQRIRERVQGYNLRLQPMYANDTATPQDIMQLVDSIADDLRQYCNHILDDEPLRFGLSLLRAVVENLWGHDNGIAFNPPELPAPQAA